MSWKLNRPRQSLKPTPRTRTGKRQWRPKLECLEDRTVPTAVLNLVGSQTLVAGTDVNASLVSSLSDFSQQEMQVAINPDDPMQVAGFTHSGNRNEILVLWSENGGTIWNETVIDGADAEDDDGLGLGHRFDPTLKFDDNGRLYIAYVFRDADQSRLMTAHSDDGGQTFSLFRSRHNSDNVFCLGCNDLPGIDKPFLTTGVDPTTNRQAVYIAYTWITPGLIPIPDNEITVVGSNDGGSTWTQPQIIDDGDSSFFAGPAVGPNGELYVVWMDHDNDQIKLDRDLDGLWGTGHGFGDDIAITGLREYMAPPPETKKPPANPKRGFTNGPSIDVSRTSPFFGRIYVTYTDTFYGDDTDIYMVSSDNKGTSWDFLATADNADGNWGNVENSIGTDFMATVAVDQTTGSVNVGYYTTAGDQATGNDDVNFRVASSINGGANWIRTNLSRFTSNAQAMTNLNEFGDYVGLAAHGGTILGLWTDNRRPTANDPFAAGTEVFAATASFHSATGGNVLKVVGTNAADIIEVMPSSDNSDYVEVVVNARREFAGLWASLDSIEVYGFSGDDEVYIHHGFFPLPVPVSIFGANGNDAIHVILPLAVGNPMGSSVKVYGGADSDTVTLWNDQVFGGPFNYPAEFTYLVTNSTVSVAGSSFGGLTYSTVEGLTLRSGAGNDTFNITSTASGVPVTVHAGEGNDISNMGSVRPFDSILPGQPNLDNLKSIVTVNGQEGTDTVNLNDQSAAANDRFTIWNSGVRRQHTSGGRVLVNGLAYSEIEGLTLTAGRGSNGISINSTALGTPVTVNAGAGNDTIGVGDPPTRTLGPGPRPKGNLDLLLGRVTVNGQSGIDLVNVKDQGAAPHHRYFIDVSELRRTPRIEPEIGTQFGGLDYFAIEDLTLNADEGDNVIGFSGLLTFPVTVNGNGGSDTLVGPDLSNTWVITGSNRGTIRNVTFATTENLAGGGDTDIFAFGGGASLAVGSINGGGGANWLDYSAYQNKVIVNLATHSATGVGASGAANAHLIQNVIGAREVRNLLTGNDDPLGNILVGGDRSGDVITGGPARGILIGGRGNNDLITGGTADDIVIGGFTDFDRDPAALQAIMGAWLSADDSYETRIAAIRAGIISRKKIYSLIWGTGAGTTVHDDGAADLLRGDPTGSANTGQDWFFANLDAGAQDVIFDLQDGEKVNNQT